jgi:pimeloyl-ACP methyl ester carboxylesterase
MARFLLVHGAFGGAWSWERVIPGLVALGHDASAFDLPGSGGDETPVIEVTLEAYASRVCSKLDSGSEPAVLVGHSMGGIAITQAASLRPERVAMLIYVCAFLPQDGQSLLDLTQLPEGADDQVQANMVVEGNPPVATLPAAAAREAAFNCCDDEMAEWALARRRPQAVAPFATPVSVGGAAFAAIPRAYVLCRRDHSIPPALQRRMIATQGVEQVVELDADHAPYLSATGELVTTLDRFAQARAP